EHRQQLYEMMRNEMEGDRARHNILPLSKFGLMQITRQRVRPVEKIDVREGCPTCKGTGKVEPMISIIDEIAHKIEQCDAKYILLQVHPFIEAYLTKGLWKTIKRDWQRKYKKKITCQVLNTLGVNTFNVLDAKAKK
nr:ribonuclease E/G [Flavobacteriaceae bacterium]